MELPRARVVFAVLSVLLGWSVGGSAEPSEIAPGTVASRARAAVVEVSVVRSTPHHVGTGTGFFVSHDGQVLTDWHVIHDAVTITVRTGRGETLTALVLAEDRQHDLAVLGITGDDFPSLQLADTDRSAPGTWITLIGAGDSPCREGHTGRIRELLGRPMLQISTPLRPGYSGSPLVDAQGRVVGIANGQYLGATPDQDESYAVPVSYIRRLLAQHPQPTAAHP